MDARGNILLVANYESDVGYAWWLMENFWVAIARHAAEQGRRCVLVYPRLNAVPAHIRESGIKVLEHDFSDTSPRGLARLRALIRRESIRAVYLTDKPYYSPQYLWLRLFGVRRLVLHDHKPGDRPRPASWKRALKRLLAAFAPLGCTYYVGVSRFVYRRFIDVVCLPPQRCGYVLNGIRPLQVDSDSRRYVRESFGLPEDALVVISTGRATYYKGVDFIIRCANRLIREHGLDRLYFLHCGDGPDLEAFRELARSLGLEDRFLFAGRRDDLPRLLPGCDIGIQASHGEAFSLSILEYMSAGLATLVPDHCGNAEAVTHELNGLLYAPGDEAGVVRALAWLVEDDAARRQLGLRARATVAERFDLARTNRTFVRTLASQL